jgi:hypothetical protein
LKILARRLAPRTGAIFGLGELFLDSVRERTTLAIHPDPVAWLNVSPSPNTVMALCTQPERVADSVIAEISVGSRASEDSVCLVQNTHSSVQNVRVNNRSVQA